MSARAGAAGSPRGAGIRSITASSTSGTPSPVFAEMRSTRSGESPMQLGDLARDGVGVSLRQVDLVHDRHDLELVLDREIRVRERLRLGPLRRVDDEQRALACLERARHLVGEVDVPGRVDQVELVALPGHPDRLGLDRDPALALEVHRVEHLLAHLALGDRVRQLEDAVGERRLAVVDVRDDREVADAALVHGVTSAGSAPATRVASASRAPRVRGTRRGTPGHRRRPRPRPTRPAPRKLRPNTSSSTHQTPYETAPSAADAAVIRRNASVERRSSSPPTWRCSSTTSAAAPAMFAIEIASGTPQTPTR